MPPDRDRPKTAAQIAAEDDARPTRNETPRSGGAQEVTAQPQDSRLNALRDAPPSVRDKLVWLTYEGRKGSRGTVRRTQDEHIDVIVPDEANEEQAEAYLDGVAPGGALTPKERDELKEQGISGDTLHLSGAAYHFVSGTSATEGEATPVLPAHVDWLLAHPGYSFKRVPAPGDRARSDRQRR